MFSIVEMNKVLQILLLLNKTLLKWNSMTFAAKGYYAQGTGNVCSMDRAYSLPEPAFW